ncbi:MAG: hypothetical protein IT379_24045, partial [Deltaproteobacteria bacterium]|nr:hypothetical protein [Deltaproteobacteria bacterium]
MGRKRTGTGRTQGTTRAIAFGVVSCLVSACASDPPDSGVYVLVDADGPVVSVACRMEMIVYGGRGTLGTEPRETRGADGLVARSWPISVGLVPDGGDASRLWGLELRVFGPGNGTCDELVLSRSVRGNFVRGQVVLLRVLLESSCLGIDCTTGGPFAATCLGGACLPVPDVRAETLPPWTPEDGVPSSFDAGGGERDAGDASSMDATRDQGGTADAEGEDAAERDATSMDARADGATDASAIDGAPMDGPARDDGAAPDATGDARDSGGTDDAGASMDASGDSGGTEDDAGTPGGDSGDTDDDAGAPTDAGGACVVASD